MGGNGFNELQSSLNGNLICCSKNDATQIEWKIHVHVQRIWNSLSLHIKLGHFQPDSFIRRVKCRVMLWHDALNGSICNEGETRERRKKHETAQQAPNELLLLLLLGLWTVVAHIGQLMPLTCKPENGVVTFCSNNFSANKVANE